MKVIINIPKNNIDWAKVDLPALLVKHNMNYVAIGRELGVSSNAVKKRYNKMLREDLI